MMIPKTHTGLIAKLWQNRKELNIDENTIKKISSSDYGVVPTVTENDLKVVENVIEKLKEVLEY